MYVYKTLHKIRYNKQTQPNFVSIIPLLLRIAIAQRIVNFISQQSPSETL
jgi:hypothetical protein